jgi:hypothetical protein
MVKAFKDPKIWISSLIQFLGDILSFGTSTFLPSIIASFGFDSVLTQLLTVPVFFWGVSVYIAMSFWSDKIQKRAYFMVPGALCAIVAYSMLVTVPFSLRGVLYFSLFILVPGQYVSSSFVWTVHRTDNDSVCLASTTCGCLTPMLGITSAPRPLEST